VHTINSEKGFPLFYVEVCMFEIDQSVAASGKKIYSELESMLISTSPGQYVAIEPVSKEYFIAKSMGEAISKAKGKYPARTFYTTAIGKPVHIPAR
jgi:hypothetical protein